MIFQRKMLVAVFAFVIAFALMPLAVPANEVTAVPSAHTVLVDGEAIAFRAFLIDGSNFVMLRDIAYTLNGTESQFDVAWDESAGAINLLSGVAYTPVGGEMQSGAGATGIIHAISVLERTYLTRWAIEGDRLIETNRAYVEWGMCSVSKWIVDGYEATEEEFLSVFTVSSWAPVRRITRKYINKVIPPQFVLPHSNIIRLTESDIMHLYRTHLLSSVEVANIALIVRWENPAESETKAELLA